MPYVYLSEAEITQINRSVGGVTTINAGGLTAAAQGPAAGFAGVDLRPTLADKAATLIIEISQGHPFNDANKRTATEALDQFIKKNRGGRGIIGGKHKAIYVVNQCADQHPALTINNGKLVPALTKLIPAAQPGEPA
ncbi:Fic family protein [Pseudomonas aeruginosa]|uniref:Fic family protein n=1 Tax=Pseudomonas TaxID=286 RepID=UPI0006903DD5|nr:MULTISPECIES: Fic family protein [Pseudomonas]AWQ82735.1 fic/DOC family protein [Pseudomonas aeruginosa]EJB8384709.1 Fic family protein [Pseudomonas aeruginosa]KRU90980.1 hypothetical protein AN455_24120 [Pseudomonas aeruginosa]KRV01273.1 hypothetical protein AN456_17415 [Pseudomonas aeruginosa]KSJ16543.1 hypothetical protein AO994_08045 [Pseudomonas aeruginosa]